MFTPSAPPSRGGSSPPGPTSISTAWAIRPIALTEAEKLTLIQLGASPRPLWPSPASGPRSAPGRAMDVLFRRRHDLDGLPSCSSSGSTSRTRASRSCSRPRLYVWRHAPARHDVRVRGSARRSLRAGRSPAPTRRILRLGSVDPGRKTDAARGLAYCPVLLVDPGELRGGVHRGVDVGAGRSIGGDIPPVREVDRRRRRRRVRGLSADASAVAERIRLAARPPAGRWPAMGGGRPSQGGVSLVVAGAGRGDRARRRRGGVTVEATTGVGGPWRALLPRHYAASRGSSGWLRPDDAVLAVAGG